MVLPECFKLKFLQNVGPALATSFERSKATCRLLGGDLPVYFAKLCIIEYLLFEMRRKSVRQAFLAKLFEALKVFNVAVIAVFVSKCRLPVDRGTISYVALAEYV